MDEIIIAVDFDGTVVDHCFPDIGSNVPYATQCLKGLQNQGHKLILWTMRSNNPKGNFLDDAVDWYKKNEIKLFGINNNPEQISWTNSPKAYAQIYIDDAAFNAPLIKPVGFHRHCMDWLVVAKHFNIKIER